MRKLLSSLSITVLAALLLCGCGIERVAMDPIGYKSIRQGNEITEEEAAQIVDGETTKDDVYLMFGKPSEILEDGHVFVYNWIRGSNANLLGFGSGSARAHSLVVTFDDNRIVKGHTITRGEVSTDIVTETTIGD
jgi:outer membrane protein assembly factor BamE (lipoprotein component of BamABCDE complex)